MKQSIIKALASAIDLDKSQIEKLLEVPPNSELGDFAFPCFILSKQLKKSPVEIAQDLSTKIKLSKDIQEVRATGPYINFFLNKSSLATSVLDEILKEKDQYGISKKSNLSSTVIEFPSPNTNKPLHLGHARNIFLGQSLSSILRASGEKVHQVNLNNDRGIAICKSMVAYELFGKGDSPTKSKRKSDHFVGDYYVKYAKESGKSDLEDKAKSCLIKWESGDKKTMDLWKKMNKWAIEGFDQTYKKLNLKFEKTYFEHKIYKKGKEIILEGLKKGVLKKRDDGSIYADLSNEGLGEKTVLRADGTSIYTTQDIYLAVSKSKDYNANKSIYVSAREQDYHFKSLFEILKLLGYKWAKNLIHVSYGMIHLESGRMKSREGNVVDIDNLLEDLSNLTAKEIEKRDNALSKKEIKERSMKVALASLRYYLLKIDKLRDTTFKPEESLSFEGNTGPYILYTYARARSILRKSKYKPSKASSS